MDGTGAPPGVVGEILADGARFGERFVAWRGTPEAPEWVPAAEYVGAGLPAALERIREVRATGSLAVAGSLLVEAYAQRLVSPVLAAFTLEGRVLDAHLEHVRVAPVDGRIGRPAFTGPCSPAGPRTVARRRAVLDGLLQGHLDRVVAAVHAHTRVGRRVLRGGVANAVALAYLHLSWLGSEPDRAHHVATARGVLADAGLGDLVTVEAVTAGGRRWMYTDRRSCCLVFRTAEHRGREQPYCLTCPVLPAAEIREHFGRATASFAERHPD